MLEHYGLRLYLLPLLPPRAPASSRNFSVKFALPILDFPFAREPAGGPRNLDKHAANVASTKTGRGGGATTHMRARVWVGAHVMSRHTGAHSEPLVRFPGAGGAAPA